MDTSIMGKGMIDVVFELGHLLNSPLDQGLVMQKAVEMLGRFLRADGSTLFIIEETRDGMEFNLAAHFGDPMPKKIDLKSILRESLPYQALVSKKSILIHEALDHPLVSRELNEITGARSLMAVPMMVKGKPVGAISVYSKLPGAFSEYDLHLLETLAVQMATALVNVKLFEYIEQLILTDGLTGLYDHNYFLRSLEVDIHEARKKGKEISLVLIDIDDFKYYNELFGHNTGDLILKQVAGILLKEARAQDLVARYGGDEFVIILKNAAKNEACRIAEEIRSQLEKNLFMVPHSKRVCKITASLGVATFPEDAESAKQLIDSADRALYRIKRSSQNRIQQYFSEFTDLEQEFSEAEKALFDTICILIEILDNRDKYTWEHSRQVGLYAMAIAREMGLPPQQVRSMRLAGYLHDIGKIHVNPAALNKGGRLTPLEYHQVKVHPVVGANLLSPIEGFKYFIPFIKHHHEWFNGTGYPSCLSGEDIPLGARILAVADGFDAMTSNRPYRRAMAASRAVEELIREKGRQYDPEVVNAFLRYLEKDGILPGNYSKFLIS